MSLAEQIEQCWRRFCKSQNELKPLYNRYKFWEG